MGLVGVVGGIHQLVRILRLGSRDVLVVSTRGVVARPLESRPIHIDGVRSPRPCRADALPEERVLLWDSGRRPRGSRSIIWRPDHRPRSGSRLLRARHPSLRDELGDVRVLRRPGTDRSSKPLPS